MAMVHNNISVSFRIAGMGYHVPTDRAVCGRFVGVLVPEPENPYDENAIKVCKEDGTLLGYVPRKKTADVKGVLDGVYHCDVEIYPLMHEGVLMGVGGRCTIESEKLEVVTREKVDDGSMEYKDGTYLIYIGDRRDSLSVVGYKEAMEKAWKVECMIDEGMRHVASANMARAWTSPRDVCLTVEMKRPWWRRNRTIVKKETVQMLEYEVYWLEKKVLKADPLRYRIPIGRRASGSTGWGGLSFAGFSLLDLFDFAGSLFSYNSFGTPGVNDTIEGFDWELFELQLDSDEYFDLRW